MKDRPKSPNLETPSQEKSALTKEEFFKALDKVIQPVEKPPPAKEKRETSG